MTCSRRTRSGVMLVNLPDNYDTIADGKLWTVYEEKYLLQFHNKLPVETLAYTLGRSIDAVLMRMRFLKLITDEDIAKQQPKPEPEPQTMERGKPPAREVNVLWKTSEELHIVPRHTGTRKRAREKGAEVARIKSNRRIPDELRLAFLEFLLKIKRDMMERKKAEQERKVV
jgi:hypothetical protein